MHQKKFNPKQMEIDLEPYEAEMRSMVNDLRSQPKEASREFRAIFSALSRARYNLRLIAMRERARGVQDDRGKVENI